MLTIKQISSRDDHDAAAKLVRELTQWSTTLDVDTSSAPTFEDLEDELADLTRVYGPPNGCFLLARDGGQPVGCAALVGRGEDVVEVKRMYVRSGTRGKGVGRKLTEELVARAKNTSAKRIILDSFHTMHTAHRIYRSVGFQDIAAPRNFPAEFTSRVVFMEMPLDQD